MRVSSRPQRSRVESKPTLQDFGVSQRERIGLHVWMFGASPRKCIIHFFLSTTVVLCVARDVVAALPAMSLLALCPRLDNLTS